MKKIIKSRWVILITKVLRVVIYGTLRYTQKKIISKKYRERLIDSMMVKLKMKEETRKMKIQRTMRNKKQQIKKIIRKKIVKVVLNKIIKK